MKLGHLLLALVLVDASAQTTVGLWRMGENDPGAANNAAINTTLTAAVGPNLSLDGGVVYGATYTSNTPGAGSSLAVTVGNGSVAYVTGNNFGLTTDFALEAWVKIAAGGGEQYIAQLGFGGSTGLALFVNNSDLIGVQTGSTLTSSTALQPNTWTHVALVAQNTTTSFYYNGVLQSGTGTVPTFGNSFSIMGNFEASSKLWDGLVDHVRIFTFANGTFNTSMLSYPASAIPEPSTYAGHVGAVAFALVMVRRRRAAA